MIALAGHAADRLSQVAAFCPTYEPRRIFHPAALKIFVVASRPIGSRDDHGKLLSHEFAIWQLGPGMADEADVSAVAGDIGGGHERLTVRRGRCD